MGKKQWAPERRTGGQPGVSVNRKHGLYSQVDDLPHLREDGTDLALDLWDEIATLRRVKRWVLELAGQTQSPQEAVMLLDALGVASVRIANLLRIQKQVLSSGSSLEDAANQALEEVMKELNLSV